VPSFEIRAHVTALFAAAPNHHRAPVQGREITVAEVGVIDVNERF
jgi:hypothetical protein